MPTQTPYMLLFIPIPETPGIDSDWATLLDDALTRIDLHNHTRGQGVPVPINGIDWTTGDVPLTGNNVTGVRTIRFDSQGAALTRPSDLDCFYVVSGDLFFNNGSGQIIQLTRGGSLNASSLGAIGGDYATAGASLSYVSSSKVFLFESASGMKALLSAGPVSIYEPILNGKSATLKVPSGLASSYQLTLPPALPAAQKFVTLDATGALTSACDVDGVTLQVAGNVISLKDGSVTSAKLATGSVTSTQLAAGAVSTAKLTAGAVTSNELGAGAVIAGKVAAGAINDSSELVSGVISNAHLAADAMRTTTYAEDGNANPTSGAKLDKSAGIKTTRAGLQVGSFNFSTMFNACVLDVNYTTLAWVGASDMVCQGWTTDPNMGKPCILIEGTPYNAGTTTGTNWTVLTSMGDPAGTRSRMMANLILATGRVSGPLTIPQFYIGLSDAGTGGYLTSGNVGHVTLGMLYVRM